jgi:hypothetical protein
MQNLWPKFLFHFLKHWEDHWKQLIEEKSEYTDTILKQRAQKKCTQQKEHKETDAKMENELQIILHSKFFTTKRAVFQNPNSCTTEPSTERERGAHHQNSPETNTGRNKNNT